MAHITTTDGVRLYVEEAGSGDPIVFVHEFAGDHRSWEPQVHYFSRRYRCITFAARGFLPSDVPDAAATYTQSRATDDVRDVMDGLGIERAHIVGLSMGGFTTLFFGLAYPERALSLVAASAGTGSEPDYHAQYNRDALALADLIETKGMAAFAASHSATAVRQTLNAKDPKCFQEFVDRLAEHSAKGSINTLRGRLASRPSIYDFEADFSTLNVPTLLIAGDEDVHCVLPSLFLKRIMRTCGLYILARTGHALNLEQPALFNQIVAEFFDQVEHHRWPAHDPKAAGDLMRIA